MAHVNIDTETLGHVYTRSEPLNSAAVSNAKLSCCRMQFVAFYSDRHHEIQKVTSGVRVSIAYSLYKEKQEEGRKATLLTYQPLAEAIAEKLKVIINYCLLASCNLAQPGFNWRNSIATIHDKAVSKGAFWQTMFGLDDNSIRPTAKTL